MPRLLPLRLLLTIFAFIGIAADSAVKVAHGEVHLAEQLARTGADAGSAVSMPAAIGGDEVQETAAEHSELHAVIVAPQTAAQLALPLDVAGALPDAVVVTGSPSPRTLASEARPPTFDGVPAQPRAPPIG